MRKTVLALTSVLIIFFLIAPIAQEVTVKADSSETCINVYSPYPAPYVYANSSVEITIDYIVPIDWGKINTFYYRLDGKEYHKLYCHTNVESDLVYYHVNWLLESVADGNHTLEVSAYYVNGVVVGAAIYNDTFTVDRSFKPTPTPTVTPMPPTPTISKEVSFEFDPTVFGFTAAMIIVTVAAVIALFYVEKYR